MFDTIIVGGGITGLQLGALLSHDGEKVLILEKGSRTGGRAVVQKRKGFIVDYGVHLIRFGPQSAISKTCRQLGHEIEYASLGTSWVMDADGKTKVFPTGPRAFLTTRLFSIGEKFRIIRMMGKIRNDDHTHLLDKSVKEWMDENDISGGLRRYFHMVSASIMVCPFIEKASAGEMLINMQKVLQTGISVMYPKGGWKPIMELLQNKVKERGEIRLKSTVEKIKVKDGKAVGVFVDGKLHEARKVVISIPSHQLSKLLPGRVDDDYIQKCKNNRPTAGIVLDYGLKHSISNIDGLCYLYNPMSFGFFTSNVEPSLAPEGKQLFTWLQPLPENKIKDRPWAKKREAELEKALFKFFPKLEKAIEWRRILFLPVVDGTEVNIEQTEDKRPSAMVPGVGNLHRVGDSVAAPGAGGDVGHESVHVTYEAIRNGHRD